MEDLISDQAHAFWRDEPLLPIPIQPDHLAAIGAVSFESLDGAHFRVRSFPPAAGPDVTGCHISDNSAIVDSTQRDVFSARQPLPPRPRPFGRQGVEPIRQGRKGGDGLVRSCVGLGKLDLEFLIVGLERRVVSLEGVHEGGVCLLPSRR